MTRRVSVSCGGKPLRVLFCSSEAYPLAKTGGLGDVSASLTGALAARGVEVRLLLPAYPSARKALLGGRRLAEFRLDTVPEPVRILEGTMPDTGVTVWLVDLPSLYDRNGGPYQSPDDGDWPDNAERFGAFARVAVALASGQPSVDWRPDLVHCNDWQTGLIPALLHGQPSPPATVFTIHNLAYQGLFHHQTMEQLGLPATLWALDGLEFYGQVSFIKGGLVYADRLTTVSPTYAREIQTAEHGAGLEGLLRHRSERMTGILNGADYQVWNPATDSWLSHHYDRDHLQGKALCKRSLQQQVGLASGGRPLLALIGRLVAQKGLELLIGILPALMARPLQLIVLGTGEPRFERALARIATQHPEQMVFIPRYDESLAHRIEAGADMFLMPSLYEPCGLNQLYSLRYGTLPIVHGVGGLADTVVDATRATLDSGTASGLVFDVPEAGALLAAVDRALDLYGKHDVWQGVVANAMALDFGWSQSAEGYLEVYRLALADQGRELELASAMTRPVSAAATC